MVHTVEESIRLAYLQAMGIETWVFQQSDLQDSSAGNGAVETVLLDDALNYERDGLGKKDKPELFVDLKPVDSPADMQKPVPENMPSALAMPPAPAAENNSTIQSIADPLDSPSDKPKFAFVSFSTTNGTLILAELGDPLAPGLSASEYALLEAVLFALKQKPAVDQPYDKELFSWPALVGAHQDRGSEAARQAVKAFINGKMKRNKLDSLLLLGAGVGQQASDFLLDGAGIKIVSTLGLSAMLNNPVLKATVWKDIQKLKSG